MRYTIFMLPLSEEMQQTIFLEITF